MYICAYIFLCKCLLYLPCSCTLHFGVAHNFIYLFLPFTDCNERQKKNAAKKYITSLWVCAFIISFLLSRNSKNQQASAMKSCINNNNANKSCLTCAMLMMSPHLPSFTTSRSANEPQSSCANTTMAYE